MKVGSLMIAAVMLTSLMPLSALAMQDGNGNQAHLRADYAPQTDNTMGQRSFEDEKQALENAKNQFKSRAMDERQFNTHVQTYLNKSIDKIDSTISKLRDRMPDRDFDQFLNETRLRLINATDKKDMIGIAKEIKDNWKAYQLKAKHKVNENASDQLNGIILNANGLARKLNTTIQAMDAKGINTTGLKAEFAQFQVQINIAYGNWTLAHSMLRNYSDTTDKNAAMDQMHVYLRNAQQALKQAHLILKDMVKEIKGLIGKPIAHGNETDDENDTDENHTDTTLPNLSIIAPLNGQNVSGMMGLNVSASDNTNVSSVAFKAGANGTLSSMALYSGNVSNGLWFTLWNSSTVSDGTLTIFVTAKDYYNNSREANLTIYVNNTG